MLGQPISMLLPEVVGFELTGELPEGATATDLVLRVTEMLREHGVVAKFVEFFGAGHLGARPRRPGDDRQHVARVRVDVRDLPVDAETLRYLEFTGRPTRSSSSSTRTPASRACSTADESEDPTTPTRWSSTSTTSSRASPGRSARRTASRLRSQAPRSARSCALRPGGGGRSTTTSTTRRSRIVPGLRPAGDGPGRRRGRQAGPRRRSRSPSRASHARRRHVTLEDGDEFDLDHGRVVIAAITSCTNTSNPSVMIGAGLLAKKAVERGLEPKPWVKTSLAPGSTVVTEYLERGRADG